MSEPPLTVEDVLAFRRERFETSLALVARKGHDYNRSQQNAGDTLFNLRVCEILGVVDSAERGILVRLSDKFMRLISLVQAGVDPAVKGESVRDTVRDIHNYADYLLQMFEERRELAQGRKAPNPPTGGAEMRRPCYGETRRDACEIAHGEGYGFMVPEEQKRGMEREANLSARDSHNR